ncbi:endonuclease/exonuclease/phosphatase domain-containing protein, putative [Eimeria acervulina]|uniref:Endonuclease/exonuclease/phosphatase domain-containing protein, putative n=1 Tax=Eimeria acervulina TaxID=5801 RepID=U6GQ13_EIMAC|nr:endonuclease/exonuclease/phosphatase domain-containing protein, putative [Eimeria acervulina]CDI81647.1 endonuclease/exonuclease/phosphatase domain-containing protein, putative [Eimeria acervulina]
MDIIAQHYGEELSDHWPLSARICIGAPRVQQQQLPRPRKQQLLRGLSLCVDASYKGSSSNQKKNQLTKKVIEAEKQLAANQLAGWRQSRAPSILEQTPEVKRLQQQREQYKRAAAAAAAEAAKAAAAEAAATAAAAAAEKEAAAEAERKALWEQQKQREPQQQQQQLEQQMQQMSITQEDSGVGVDDQQQTAGQQDAAAASASHAAGEDKAKKSVPLAAQRAREAMKARRKPLRM